MSYPIQYVIVSALFDPSLICSVVNVQNDRDYAFCISAIIASNIIACLGKKMFKLMYLATLGKDKGGGGGRVLSESTIISCYTRYTPRQLNPSN